MLAYENEEIYDGPFTPYFNVDSAFGCLLFEFRGLLCSVVFCPVVFVLIMLFFLHFCFFRPVDVSCAWQTYLRAVFAHTIQYDSGGVGGS